MYLLLGLKFFARRRTWAGIHLPIDCKSCTVSVETVNIASSDESPTVKHNEAMNYVTGEFSGMACIALPYR
jgi:hypothetical protein